jgi:chromosome segregation ATPase
MASLTLSIIEIVVLMLGAIVLGITIHFFITSRRNLKGSLTPPTKPSQGLNEWKLKYFNDIEIKEKELTSLRQRAEEAEDNSNIFSIEAEELRKQNKKLQAELEAAAKGISPTAHRADRAADKADYFDQLREAQSSLAEHSEKINMLLGNIDMIKDSEERHKKLVRDNAELSDKVTELRSVLAEKDREMNSIRQKASLSKEMSSMLDSMHNEFDTLQGKIQKLESQVSSSRMTNMEFEDMKEEHYKLRRDYEEQKVKMAGLAMENKEMQLLLAETEDKLKEANFQRQQLQKRVSYLEEMNTDLQEVSDANKRLEGQIKRIGELESMLNVVSEERDQLMRRQM